MYKIKNFISKFFSKNYKNENKMGVCGSSNKHKKHKTNWNKTHGEEKDQRESGATAVIREAKLGSVSMRSDLKSVQMRKQVYKDKSAPNAKRNSVILKKEPMEVEDDFIQQNYEKFKMIEYSKFSISS